MTHEQKPTRSKENYLKSFIRIVIYNFGSVSLNRNDLSSYIWDGAST